VPPRRPAPRIAYVDSSVMVALAFGEAGSGALARTLAGFDRLVASNLLEAELRSALAREDVADEPTEMLSGLSWLHPDRPLGVELRRALAAGRLRGADLWQVACALFLAPEPRELAFVTLDARQAEVAAALGFPVLPSG